MALYTEHISLFFYTTPYKHIHTHTHISFPYPPKYSYVKLLVKSASSGMEIPFVNKTVAYHHYTFSFEQL